MSAAVRARQLTSAVLHTILHRYSLRQIYTYSGIVLVAVNPFSSLSVYSSSIVQAYAGRRKGELEPHLFAIAEEAYRCMVGTASEPGGNQTIIVSGERCVPFIHPPFDTHPAAVEPARPSRPSTSCATLPRSTTPRGLVVERCAPSTSSNRD